MMRHIAFAIIALALAGCETASVVPSKLSPPSSRLMGAPVALSDVKAGDDLVQVSATCRAQYGRETGKLTGLQGYVRTILKK
jgi:hypothetical protein